MAEQPSTPESLPCCVCGELVPPPYNMIGQRVYCARHYALVNKPNNGFWRAGLIQILGMAAFSAVVALIAANLGPLDQTALILVGVFLALVPTAIWLVFFYTQDRLEPEPKLAIFQVLLLAFLLADVLGVRLIEGWLQTSLWSSTNTTTSLLASILIRGFVWQAIAYFAVRLVVYDTPEFDERMDGIIYGTVAGLGIATLLNLRFIFDNQGVELGPGVIRCVTTTLAMASFSGLMGYFMAEAKFDSKPAWWVPLGVAVAAALNGLFNWLIGEVSASGISVDPWRSLALGVVVALLVFLVLVMLMRQVTEVTLRMRTR